VDTSSPDIAVEFLQKSAPSPIRKLHKKYASHVARCVVEHYVITIAMFFLKRLIKNMGAEGRT